MEKSKVLEEENIKRNHDLEEIWDLRWKQS